MPDYIYALCCPETADIRYIGKTKNPHSRLRSHVWKAHTEHVRHYCSAWIRTLLARGLEPEIVVLFEVPAGERWQDHEKRLIAEYKALGARLTNATGGGDGFYQVPPELIARRAAAQRATKADPEYKARQSARSRAYANQPEVKKARSDEMKAAWSDPEKAQVFLDAMRTPEAVRNRSNASRKRMTDPVVAAQHSAKMKIIGNTPERRAKAREISLAAWADPEITERRVAAIKETHGKPEVKAKLAESMAKVRARPGYKEERSRIAKTNWSDPDYRENMLSHLQSEEFSQHQSDAIKDRWSDPEAREKLVSGRWTPERRAQQGERIRARNAERRGKPLPPETKEKWTASAKLAWVERKAKAKAQREAETIPKTQDP